MTQASALSRLEKLAEEYASARYHRVDTNWQLCKQNFMEVAKSVLSLLSEPGEACGPRAILGKVDYCDLRELLQARAAHSVEVNRLNYELDKSRASHCAALASSEARVRSLAAVLEKMPCECQSVSPLTLMTCARCEALLEVQR